MKSITRTLKALSFVAVALVNHPAAAESLWLPRSTPEAQGVSSAGIREFVEAADRQVNTMHSFMLVRHGHVVAEGWWKPEAPDKPHVMHSLSKRFTVFNSGAAATARIGATAQTASSASCCRNRTR